MDSQTTLNYFFLAGWTLGIVVRVGYGRRQRQNRIVSGRKEPPPAALFMGLWGLTQLLPLFYIFSAWLSFADYARSDWLGWLGAALFYFGLWLLWRSHADLGRNWSPSLEIRAGHDLVTGGVYRRIRHPMYAAHLLWALGQALLLPNWLAGPGGLVAMLPLYLLRVDQEEGMMLAEFGEQYKDYMGQTGRLFPK